MNLACYFFQVGSEFSSLEKKKKKQEEEEEERKNIIEINSSTLAITFIHIP
jgi:uncharacterized protein (DUF2225 family)